MYKISDTKVGIQIQIVEWSPGIGFGGIDDSFQSQLHFTEAIFDYYHSRCII